MWLGKGVLLEGGVPVGVTGDPTSRGDGNQPVGVTGQRLKGESAPTRATRSPPSRGVEQDTYSVRMAKADAATRERLRKPEGEP